MDPLAPNQHSLARPQSQQDFRDLRRAPIPPPPYSARPSPVRPEILHHGDPFLQRRVSITENRPNTIRNPSYGYSNTSNHMNVDSGPQEHGRSGRGPQRGGGQEHIRQYEGQMLDAHTSPSTLPPSSFFQAHNQPPPTHHDISKSTPNSTFSSTMFAAEPPAPPPPPYGGARTMLPPTSPPHSQPQYNGGQSTPSRLNIPVPPSFSGPRDLPALPTSRPESSMSISSMLGCDVGQVSKDRSMAQRNLLGANTSDSFSSPSHAITSPTRRNMGQGLFRRRSPSPIDRRRVQGAANRPFRAYSNDTQRHLPPHARPTSPKAHTSASSLGQLGTQRSPTSEQGLEQQWRFSYHRQPSENKLGKRPSSQPSGYGTPSQAVDTNEDMYAKMQRGFQAPQQHERLPDDAQRMLIRQQAEQPSQNFLEEQIRRSREDRAAQAASNRQSPKMIAQPRSFARPSVNTGFPNNRFRSDIENVDHVYNREPLDVPQTTQSPFSPDHLRRSREERLAVNEPQPPSLTQSNSSQSRYSDRPEERHRQQFSSVHQTSAAHLNRSISTNGIDQANKVGDENVIQQPRHSLSLLIESGKRGRVSPLPQAVQGAQGRNSGPASDPGIKNEFGRMFSGIGSGVGSSGPMGSGTSTPFLGSPKVNHEPERRTPFAPRGDLIEMPRSGNRSKLGKRGLGRDGDSRAESEAAGTPNPAGTSGAQAVKKRRMHHHHPHSHHSHHHHRHDDGVAGLNSLSSMKEKRLSTPGQSSIMGPSANHHHHRHHHHHHHHAKPASTIPQHVPSIIIKNDQLLSSVSHLPRYHLGSTLYSPVLESASVTAGQHDTTSLGVSSIPTPLPRFDGKENCLFAIRIPRFYLTDIEREEITRRRAVWGCDVYTDDSDPLAAAIHAGWVQGHWGEDVDVSMLEYPSSILQSADKPTVIDVDAGETTILTSPPPLPMVPPHNKDLHLTCLVLPALEKYTSKICHGIRSREWGDNHDGMSFRIESIEWVDEGASKGEERTGEARRKRFKALLEERRGFGRAFVSPVVKIGGNNRDKGGDTVAVGG